MNPEIKQQWIAALKSGAYKQTTGRLRQDDCFCAYGVLCDLYVKANKENWNLEIGKNGTHSLHDQWGVVPGEVYRWAELDRQKVCQVTDDPTLLIDIIVNLNDKQKKPFTEIADYIEQNL